MPNIPFKGIALAAALAVGAVALSQPAEARSRAPGIIAGIALGAIIAGAVTHDRRHHYRGHHYKPYRRHYGHKAYYYSPPPPPYYAPPPVVYSYAPPPWTPDWYAYCASKYRSFDARSGTYQPYHGPRRLCH